MYIVMSELHSFSLVIIERRAFFRVRYKKIIWINIEYRDRSSQTRVATYYLVSSLTLMFKPTKLNFHFYSGTWI